MNLDLILIEIAIALAVGVVVSCYVALIVALVWCCYGWFWEKLIASFFMLFILGTLFGIGAAVGLVVVWMYDQYVQ